MSILNAKIDLGLIGRQFEGLNGRHPGLWPLLPRVSLMTGLVALVMAAAWLLHWQAQVETLEASRAEETRLQAQFVDKMKQAVNLPVLLEQKEQVARYVNQLEKQLPSKAEMDALLSDINQAGVGRGLQFELFRPAQVSVREYYAELPISIRLSGNYHDFAEFTSDVANLSRIVTLHDIRIESPSGPRQLQGSGALPMAGPLVMEATAKTFRFLDTDEIAEQRRIAAAKAAATKGRAPVRNSGADK
jgi:type IV pilus assembly protein PilO